MSYNPNNPNGQTTSANSAPVVIASDQSAVPTSVASLPLPAGASTAANQATIISDLATIASNTTNSGTPTVSGTVSVSNFPATQPVSVVSLPLPTGAATSANQATEISSLATIASNTTNASTPVVSGTVTANAGTNLNTSALALESGGHLASIDSKLTSPLAVTGTFYQATQPVSATSLPLPTGAATSALQSTINTTLGSPMQQTGGTVTANAGTGTFAVSAAALPLPTGAATAANQATEISSLSTIATNTTGASTAANQTTEIGYLSTIASNTGSSATDFQASGTITALNGNVSITGQGVYTITFSVTGTWSATLVIEGQLQDTTWVQIPINIISSTLPYQQTSTIITNGQYLITGGGFLNVRIRASAYTSGTVAVGIDGSLSQQTVIANITTPDLSITGAAAQTATVNNILSSTSGSAATLVTGFHSASVQVTSTGTGGTFIFEGSNDNVNFQTIPVYNQLILTGTPVTAAITAIASQLIYTFPVSTNYIRLRIATAITGGSIQAFTKLSQTTWTPAVFQVAQATTASLQTTSTIASGTVTTVSTVTNSNAALPTLVADVVSAAITTTTTTGTLTPGFGSSYQVNIPVTAFSGTSPTMDVEIQESADSGTNWYAVYDFPRITTTGSYNSPVLPLTGNRVRYVQTISGTTPSFTRAINRLQESTSKSVYRQIIDRTISLTTLASSTVSLQTGGGTNAQLVINIGATTIAPILQLQGSDDFGSTWYNIGSTLTAVASSTVSLTVNNVTSQFVRATVSTAGTATTAGYVLVRIF